MQLGMTQSLSMGMEQKIKLSHELRLEQRQQMAQKMGFQMMAILDGGADAMAEQYESVVQLTQDAVTDPQLREAVGRYLRQEQTKATLIAKPHILASPNLPKITEHIADRIYTDCNGDFEFQAENSDETERVTTTRGRYNQALTDPESLVRYIEDLDSQIQDDRSSMNQGALQERNESADALQIAAVMGPTIASVSKLLYYSGTIQDENKERPLRDFFRDRVILEQLMYITSERLQRQFASRFAQVNKSDNAEKHTMAMVNITGEYVLISMGIVAPELFQLKRRELDKEAYEDAKEALQKDGVDLDATMEKIKLRKEGTLYWNRWAVQGQKTDRITDDLVRDFITQTVRVDSEQILEALDFHAQFPRIKEVATSRTTSKEDRLDAHDDLKALLLELYDQDEFKSTILQLIRKKWYDKLEIFRSDNS